MFGVDLKVFMAATKFEEIEGGVAVTLRGGTRGERAVGLVETAPAEAIGGIDAGVGMLQGEAQEVGSMQAQAFAGLVGTEDGGGRVVEEQQ